MTLKFSVMEKIVGAFILLTILTFLFTVVLVGRGQNWFRKHVIYYATYQEGYNLSPGAKVRLLRMNIGQVTHVDLTEDNTVRVTMRVLAAYSSRIRADSRAVIESPTIIGSEYINIIPGSNTAKLIEPGGEIPSTEQKKISDYLSDFDIEHKLLLFDEILDNLSSLTDQLSDPEGPLFGTMKNVKRVTSHVTQGHGTLGRIIQDEDIYNRILQELARIDNILASIEKAAGSTAGASVNVKDITADVKAKLPDVVSRIQEILERLEAVSAQLEKAMNEVPDISQQTRQGMRDVNKILESVKKNFLIRSNLPSPPVPESHGLEIRGD